MPPRRDSASIKQLYQQLQTPRHLLVRRRSNVEGIDTLAAANGAETVTKSANEVAIATYPPSQSTNLVTALITAADNLKLTGWQMNDDGSFTKGLNVIAETASEICCAYVTGSIVVTAFKTSSSHFKLIYWQFPASPSDPQTITQIAEVDGGAIPYGGLSVGHWRAQNASATDLGETLITCITNSGALKLIRFHLTSS